MLVYIFAVTLLLASASVINLSKASSCSSVGVEARPGLLDAMLSPMRHKTPRTYRCKTHTDDRGFEHVLDLAPLDIFRTTDCPYHYIN